MGDELLRHKFALVKLKKDGFVRITESRNVIRVEGDKFNFNKEYLIGIRRPGDGRTTKQNLEAQVLLLSGTH